MFYWALEQYDGTVIYIPPESVAAVKQKWSAREPVHTTSGSIPPGQIKSFRPSERAYNPKPLLEAASQAFNDPMYTGNGSMAARWVKKDVPQQRWDRYYSQHNGYRKLYDLNGFVTVAYRLPVHQIKDTAYCTDEEVNILTSRI